MLVFIICGNCRLFPIHFLLMQPLLLFMHLLVVRLTTAAPSIWTSPWGTLSTLNTCCTQLLCLFMAFQSLIMSHITCVTLLPISPHTEFKILVYVWQNQLGNALGYFQKFCCPVSGLPRNLHSASQAELLAPFACTSKMQHHWPFHCIVCPLQKPSITSACYFNQGLRIHLCKELDTFLF